MLIIMQGRCSDAIMGAILTGLRMKGESIDEITASASAMRALAANIEATKLRLSSRYRWYWRRWCQFI